MDIQKKIDTQKEKIKKLEAEVKQNKDAKHKALRALSLCNSNDEAFRKAKKWRIIWLIIAGVMTIEMIPILGRLIQNFQNFGLSGILSITITFLIVTIIPLCLAIKNQKKVKTFEGLDAQRQNLENELARYNDVEEELENLKSYTGRDWDISTFQATPENVAAMEKDFEDLLIALHFSNDKDFKINCWLSANEIKRSTAEFGNQKGTVAAYARGTTAIKNAGSWKLEVALIAMATISMALLNVALYNGQGSSATFEELLGKSNVRKPVNEDEKALLALTSEVISDLAFEVKYSLMKMRS